MRVVIILAAAVGDVLPVERLRGNLSGTVVWQTRKRGKILPAVRHAYSLATPAMVGTPIGIADESNQPPKGFSDGVC